MKILVTGSNGCVGKSLKFLCENDKENFWIFLERKDCDLLDRDKLINIFNEIKADSIIHLASYVPGFYNINRVASLNINVKINENVLEASNVSGIKKGIFCLSVNMFPDVPISFPMNESMILDGPVTGPFQSYAFSKKILEIQCQNYNLEYGRNYFGVIPSNIYGDYDNFSSGRLIPNLILNFKKSIENNSNIIINGSGAPLRQFIYSYDLCKILKFLILNYSNNNPIICCSDEEITIKELCYKISNLINFKKEIIFDHTKIDGVIRKTVSNGYLKSIMPNVSFTSLNDGLKSVIKNNW